MRARVLAFVQDLRSRGIDVSVAESLDALAAVATAGIERPVLREALAATLVKDERDRDAFDVLFDEAFPLVGPPRRAGPAEAATRRRNAGEPGGHGRGDGEGQGRRAPAADPRDARPDRRAPRGRGVRGAGERRPGVPPLRARERRCWRCPSTTSAAAT